MTEVVSEATDEPFDPVTVTVTAYVPDALSVKVIEVDPSPPESTLPGPPMVHTSLPGWMCATVAVQLTCRPPRITQETVTDGGGVAVGLGVGFGVGLARGPNGGA